MKKNYKFLFLSVPAILPVAAVVACGHNKENDDERKSEAEKKEEREEKQAEALITEVFSKNFRTNLQNRDKTTTIDLYKTIHRDSGFEKIAEQIGINIDKKIINYIDNFASFTIDENFGKGKITFNFDFRFRKFAPSFYRSLTVEGFMTREKFEKYINASNTLYELFNQNDMQNIDPSLNTPSYEFFQNKYLSNQELKLNELHLPNENKIYNLIYPENVLINFKVKDISKNNLPSLNSESQNQFWVKIEVSIGKDLFFLENKDLWTTSFQINNLRFTNQK